MLKFSGSIIWRLSTRAITRKYSAPGATIAKNENLDLTQTEGAKVTKSHTEANDNSGLVAAAFASLNSPEDSQKTSSPKSAKPNKIQLIDAQIQKATDVNSLLVVAENAIVSRRHALKVVSVLSEWSSGGRARLAEFEKDPRFLKLCRILARSPAAPAAGAALAAAEDLSTVLGVTGDDEAARLIANLTTQQMIKVLKALQQKARRSPPLLRALAHGLAGARAPLDLKRAADLLYCAAALSYPDPLLLDRACEDVVAALPANESRPAAVASAARSLGLLRYRHEAALGALARWLQQRPARAADLAAAAVTLATVGYEPPGTERFFELVCALREEDLARPAAWLDLVFALATLERATPAHLASVLRADFIERLLSTGEIPVSARRRLQMLAALAPAGGPAREAAAAAPLVYSREKQLFVLSVHDAFKSLVSADAFVRKHCDSGMGFLFDAEFALDSNCHPVPLEKAAQDKSVHRIAVLALDYHDMARRVPAPLGPLRLAARLLAGKGYRVLQVPYTEFDPRDRLVTRVQYLEKRLKELVAAHSA